MIPPALAGEPRFPTRRVFNPSCTAKLTDSTRVRVCVRVEERGAIPNPEIKYLTR